MKTRTRTKGNVVVEDIKVGDTHYVFEYGQKITIQVKTKPTLNDKSQWEWQSTVVNNGDIVNYLVDPQYTQDHPNLYDYEAYMTGIA